MGMVIRRTAANNGTLEDGDYRVVGPDGRVIAVDMRGELTERASQKFGVPKACREAYPADNKVA